MLPLELQDSDLLYHRRKDVVKQVLKRNDLFRNLCWGPFDIAFIFALRYAVWSFKEISVIIVRQH